MEASSCVENKHHLSACEPSARLQAKSLGATKLEVKHASERRHDISAGHDSRHSEGRALKGFKQQMSELFRHCST